MQDVPDKWVVVKIQQEKKDDMFKLFTSWSGGYLSEDRWRMNSGIVRVEEDDMFMTFYGNSGSEYVCRKGSYGTTFFSEEVINGFIERLKEIGVLMTIMPEDFEFFNKIT